HLPHHSPPPLFPYTTLFRSLTINARDAMAQGGKLLLETDNTTLDDMYARKHLPMQPGSYVRLAVSDTGCGMDEATQSRIFEPFLDRKSTRLNSSHVSISYAV